MNKKLLSGLLLTVISTFTFFSCANANDGPKENNGTAPIITDAFFAKYCYSNSLEDTKNDYLINNLDLNRKTDYLIISIDNPDNDVVEVQFSSTIDFQKNYHWKNLTLKTPSSWTCFTVGWNLLKDEKPHFLQTDKPIYVRVIDKKGNKSNPFTIPEITITNDPGTKPIINDAFFAKKVGSSFEDTKDNYIRNDLDVNRTTDCLILKIEDSDCDVDEVRFSQNINFSNYYCWTDLYKESQGPSDYWRLRLNWNLSDSEKAPYIQANKPIYIKVIDKKNNASEIFTISDITITNEPGTAPEITEAYFCAMPDKDNCWRLFDSPDNNKPAALTELERCTTIPKDPPYCLYISLRDSDMDVIILDEITIPNINMTLGHLREMTSEDSYCFEPMAYTFDEIPDSALSEDGYYTFKFQVTDSKKNKSNIIDVKTKIK